MGVLTQFLYYIKKPLNFSGAFHLQNILPQLLTNCQIKANTLKWYWF